MQLGKLCGWVLVALCLAGGLAAPVSAQDAQADQAQALLQQGVDQYANLEFVEAKQSLLQASEMRDQLSREQADQLDQYLTRVNVAIDGQSAGNDAYEQAQTALEDGRFADAERLYQQVAANEYLPTPVRDEARAQAALAQQRATMATEAAPAAPAEPAVIEPVVTPIVPAETPAETPTEVVEPVEAPVEVVETPVVPAETVETPVIAEPFEPIVPTEQVPTQPAFEPAAQPAQAPAIPEAVLVQRGQQPIGAIPVPAETTALDELIRQRQVQRDRAQTLFEQQMLEAERLLAGASSDAQFQEALGAAQQALNTVDNARTFFPVEQYATLRQQAESMIQRVRGAQTQYNIAQAAAQEQQIIAAAREQQLREEQLRQDQLQARREQINSLEEQGRLREALDQLEEFLRLDPTSVWAQGKYDSLRRMMYLRDQSDALDTIHSEEVRQLVEIEWDQVPWYDLLRYPRDWPAITERRGADGLGDESESELNRQVRRDLRRIVPSVQLQNIEFAEAINFIRAVGEVSIVVNWQALGVAGVTESTSVNIQLANVTVEKALRTILDSVGGLYPLAYIVDEGVITISTREDLNQKTFVRVYDIRDLIVRVPNFSGPDLSLSDATGGTGSGSGFGDDDSGSGGIFGDDDDDDDDGDDDDDDDDDEGDTPSRSEMVQIILTMIRNTIDPVSWIEYGGTVGSIQELNGQIIVTQTSDNHTALLGLLRQLRETRALQVNIEARFITVSTGFLNDIGVDLDFYFNLGSELARTNAVDPVTGARIVGPGPQLPQWAGRDELSDRFTPFGVTQSSAVWSAPSGTPVANSIGSSVTGSALSLGGTFLDDIQVDFLIRATQADQRTTTLTAPRLTLFNGQRAYVAIVQQTQYIASLEPVVAENVVAFEPIPGVVGTGTVLDVEATISADRRYVTLTVRPTVSRIDGFTKYFTVVTSTDQAGDPLTGSGYIQLPTITLQQVETTVHVPDGGTLLVGGQRLAGEVTREMGVPLLNKIPVVNRLFSNRTTVRDQQTLLILIKPTIIIPQEIEEQTFGRM